MQIATIDRTKAWTVDDYLLLGEIKTPGQLINGELIISPAHTPYHQKVLSNLDDLFKAAAKKIGGEVYFSQSIFLLIKKTSVSPTFYFLVRKILN